MKILVVDDELDIRNLIKLYLQNENMEIIEAVDGLDATLKVDESIDVILLDYMMPKLNGVDTCIEIRKKFNTPIIFLTSKSEDMDKFASFSVGGDDYITKPFNPIDLLTRIKALHRRYRSYTKQETNSKIIELGELTINLLAKTVKKREQILSLTKKEFGILELLLTNQGQVLSLEQIYEKVWNDPVILNAEATVSVHIRNLRNKIEDDIANPQYIKTVWGIGYRID